MDPDQAIQEGYKSCGFCFANFIYLPEIGLEKHLALESAARLRYYSPISINSEKQKYLNQVGNRVLQNWPFKLLGYHYSFRLIDGPELNASALPDGVVYIQSCLFDSLESEDELEAVICHEISHVERRHILKEYKASMAVAQGTAVMAAIAAGAIGASSSGDNYSPAMIGGLALIGLTAAQIQLQGYSKDFEKEADFLTTLYFDVNRKPEKSLKSMFKKFGYLNLAMVGDPDAPSANHPQLRERIQRAEHTKYNFWGKDNSFVHKRKNKTPVRLDILYHRFFDDESYVETYIDDYSVVKKYLLTNKGELKLQIPDNGKSRSFTARNIFTTRDTWGAYLMFQETFITEKTPIEYIDEVSLILIEKTDRPENSIQNILEFKETSNR